MENWKNLSLKNIEGEIWVPMPNYENQYLVSNMGRVQSLERVIGGKKNNPNKTKNKIMSQGINNTGYCATRRTFFFNGKQTNLVHRLVGITFLPNPLNLPEVNHIGENGNKQDNRVESLIWSTHADNIKHASEVLDVNGGLKHFRCKLKEQDVIDIFYSKIPNRELAKKYEVTSGVICAIKNKKSYKSILKNHTISKIFNSQRGFTEEDILSIYNCELSYVGIAKKFGISVPTVSLIKTGKRYSEITGGRRQKSYLASVEQVLDIRNGGLSTSELIAKYGFSKSFINKIKSKKTYSWI